MPDELILLPHPRRINRHPDHCNLAAVKVNAYIDPKIAPPQGYQIIIKPQSVQIIARDEAGLFYGRQTFAQIRTQFGARLPCMSIKDWPDFVARGVMLDVSRDKVPTMATLLSLIDKLAGWKINQLQLYIEHTFAYQNHPDVWRDADPFTAAEIREIDAYCKARFIDLVPNQNSFGHMERWLKHPRYLSLAEAPEGALTPWGYFWDGPFSLCPTDPKSIELLSELYAELLPNFSSRFFNVGCDETFDIGLGRSAAECRERGTARVYLDFLKRVHGLVKQHGRRMMFWGDIIKTHPEMIGEIEGAIGMVWGYEADSDFDVEAAAFDKAGVDFYVCPGTSSWCSIGGRTKNMIANTYSAARSGLMHGAIGYLITDWGDHGHLQYLPISYAGFAMGAACSWCSNSNASLPLAAALDLHAFGDRAGVMGKAACDLGNVYLAADHLVSNATSLFRILVPPRTPKIAAAGISRSGLDAVAAAIDEAIAPLSKAQMTVPDADMIVSEFRNAAAMLKFACDVGRRELGQAAANVNLSQIIIEHRRLWLARNRAGGLEDSVRRLAVHLAVENIFIRRTDVQTIRPLRHLILRAGLPAEAANFDGDDEPTTYHIGAFDANGNLIGCATIVRRAWQNSPAWQLRGMAVSADARRLGVGRKLLDEIDRIVRDDSYSGQLWCNARTPATAFYSKMGWSRVGEEFHIPTAGPHFQMVKLIIKQ